MGKYEEDKMKTGREHKGKPLMATFLPLNFMNDNVFIKEYLLNYRY